MTRMQFALVMICLTCGSFLVGYLVGESQSHPVVGAGVVCHQDKGLYVCYKDRE